MREWSLASTFPRRGGAGLVLGGWAAGDARDALHELPACRKPTSSANWSGDFVRGMSPMDYGEMIARIWKGWTVLDGAGHGAGVQLEAFKMVSAHLSSPSSGFGYLSRRRVCGRISSRYLLAISFDRGVRVRPVHTYRNRQISKPLMGTRFQCPS